MKCGARVVKTYKRAKADAIWPETIYGAVQEDKLIGTAECGGKITIKVRAAIDGGCSCCGWPEIEVDISCSRCKAPYFKGIFELTGNPADNIGKVLEEYYEQHN